jgi:hypothetical protein
MKKIVVSVLSYIMACGLIISCGGGDDLGGDSQDFTRIYVFASVQGIYEADAVIATDTDEDELCDSLLYESDNVNISLTSQVYPSANDTPIVGSPVKISQYIVEFTPLENSPALPPKQIVSEWTIAPDTTTTIAVRIIDIEDKFSTSYHPLNYSDYLDFISAGGASYEYRVKVSLRAQEVLSGVEKTIEFEFTLYYFDIEDDCNYPVS